MTNEDILAKSLAELKGLRALTNQLEEASTPSTTDIQAALERGFACLISVEAELQRVAADQSALTEQATALHAALINLRELSGTRASSWRTQGFVLPVDDVRSRGAERRIPRLGRGSKGRVSPKY
jgi:hypothetical protein